MIAALRLYQPGSVQPRTLDDVYRLMEPDYPASMSPRSKVEQRTALKHWRQGAGDPHLGEINRQTIIRFRDYLIGTGISSATINKVWRTLRAMLRYAHDELGWIEVIPSVSPFLKSRLVDTAPSMPREVLSHEELARMWANCLQARYPVVEPCLAWRTFLVLAWSTGMRTHDLVYLPTSAILWHQKLIRFAADKTSKLQGLPLTPMVEWHLQRWLAVAPAGPRIFNGFSCRGHTNHVTGRTRRGYYTEWNQVITAGVEPRPLIKCLRADMITELNDEDAGVGGWAAAHAPIGVTSLNYDKPSKRVRRAFANRPVPPCFLWGMHDEDTHAETGSRLERAETAAGGSRPGA